MINRAIKAKIHGVYFYKRLKLLKEYIARYPECLTNVVHYHCLYGSLQPIVAPPIPFHILIVDIVTGLLTLYDDRDTMISVTDKFTKWLMYGIELRQAWDMMPQAFDHNRSFKARLDAEQSLVYTAI
ncbi:hypothetical protein N7468_007314 [Penicillium chermesinum]|uniref:Uncharacterized protein n=1 Tax=Penicillium chermesinum TaxID=63820 RepID=A0A9W9NWT1_9EURO|nr:uncharacterized protein N7468_007314 [Penicillium chermesinum]KAJ5226089.1 hypothetical protein N7468_007314 [Penicillium chermesinum]